MCCKKRRAFNVESLGNAHSPIKSHPQITPAANVNEIRGATLTAPPSPTVRAAIADCVAQLLAERIIAPFRADDVADAIAVCVEACAQAERDVQARREVTR